MSLMSLRNLLESESSADWCPLMDPSEQQNNVKLSMHPTRTKMPPDVSAQLPHAAQCEFACNQNSSIGITMKMKWKLTKFLTLKSGDCDSGSLADNASGVDTEYHPRPLRCDACSRNRDRLRCDSAAGRCGGPAELKAALVAVDAMRGGAVADHGHH
jgi:hypothetical protein